MHETIRILLYGLLAAASPLTLLAALVVLAGRRGRANGVAFAAAFVLGQSMAFVLAFLVGSHFAHRNHHPTSAAYLELAIGAALLVTAFWKRPPHEPEPAERTPRTEALFATLSRVTPGISLGIGLPLGIGAKRLAITIVAGATVALADLGPSEEVGLGALYVVVATVTVWAPVTVYLLLGTRANGLVVDSERWITSREKMLTFAVA